MHVPIVTRPLHAANEGKEAAVATRAYKEFEPTTTKQLNVICWQTKPWKDKKPSRLFSSQFAVAWKVDCDEVYPGKKIFTFMVSILRSLIQSMYRGRLKSGH